MIMILKNKLNGQLFELVKDEGDFVVLKRCKDEKVITVSKKKFLRFYKNYQDKGKITFLNTIDSEDVVEKFNKRR